MGRKKRSNDWKKRDGIVFSTSDDFDYEYGNDGEQDTLPPSEQRLKISLDSKARAGKKVTLITGFVGSDDDLKELARKLKNHCGVGGSSKDGELLLQGDFRDKARAYLTDLGYRVS